MSDDDLGMLSGDDDDALDYSEDLGTEEELFDDDFDLCLEVDGAKGKEEEEAFQYDVLKPHDITDSQLKNIGEITELFEVPASTARILLQHFGWDKERLIERYYDGDPAKLYADARIVDPGKRAKDTRDPKVEVCCEICYVDYLPGEMTGLACGHVFCRSCWLGYLRTKVMDEGVGTNITCPAHGCAILVDEITVTGLAATATEQRLSDKYHYLIAKDFVQDNKHVKWCPAPGCENAVRVAMVQPKLVTCACGNRFCFGCLQPDHTPVDCAMLARWAKKCADDSETANWISANTKECPTCKTTIEKSGGCNHMVCKNGNCRFEFCWVCLGSWEPHGSSWYNCNRFNEKESEDARESQSRSRQTLERYLHYYSRYHNHEQSAKFETQLYETMRKKMEQMQQFNMSWIEVQYLEKAVDILCECRRALKYTYAFGFYLKKNNEAHIFEDNQKDMENACEALSEYLERDLTEADLLDIKQKVLDKSQYCEKRRKTLVDHVQKGFALGVWTFNMS